MAKGRGKRKQTSTWPSFKLHTPHTHTAHRSQRHFYIKLEAGMWAPWTGGRSWTVNHAWGMVKPWRSESGNAAYAYWKQLRAVQPTACQHVAKRVQQSGASNSARHQWAVKRMQGPLPSPVGMRHFGQGAGREWTVQQSLKSDCPRSDLECRVSWEGFSL